MEKYAVNTDAPLLLVLRDELNLVGRKFGCRITYANYAGFF